MTEGWTDEQRKKIHAMLRDLARKAVHPQTNGPLSEETWKALTLEQYGFETAFLPSLDGKRMVPVSWSFKATIAREKVRACDYVEFLYYYGATQGVEWSDPEWVSQQLALAREGK